MELEDRVERFAFDFGRVREEIGRARAGLQQAQDGPPGPPAGHSSHGSEDPRREERAGPAAEGTGPLPDRPIHDPLTPSGPDEGGLWNVDRGLSLSRHDLQQVLSIARADAGQATDADGRGLGKARLTLEQLAHAIREAGPSSRGASDTTKGKDEVLTMPLSRLARMLKDPQPVSGDGAGLGAAARRPARVVRPAATRPSDGRVPEAHNLDVNLLANLMRWVGAFKRRFGLRHMEPVLGVYGLTGHMTPIVEEAIFHIAPFSLLPDDSDYHTFTEDDLVDALMGLHGIIYGSGRPPVEPAGDSSETGTWPSFQNASPEYQVPYDEPAQRAGDAPKLENDSMAPAPVPMTDDPLPSQGASDIGPAASRLRPSRRRYEEALSRFRAAMHTSATLDQDRGAGSPRNKTNARTPGEDSESAPTPGIDEQSSNGRYRAQGIIRRASEGSDRNGKVATIRRSYPSDVTETEWRRIKSLVPQVKPGGRPGKYQRREILNGILFQLSSGCSWRGLPQDLPPWKIVHHYSRTWRNDGTWGPVIATLSGHRHNGESEEGAASDPLAHISARAG